jgi:cell wall-active antibiotic response 4TMS protein YvqF
MSSPTSSPRAAVTTRHPTLSGEQVPARRGAVAILSHLRRDADWILPRLFRVLAFWGNAEIDLTQALVGEGTSIIEVKCIMASVVIRVPPDLRVENEVEAVLGSAEVRRNAPTTAAPGAPTIRITGSTFLGSLEIKIIDPNAPGLIERIRRRLTT